MRRAGISGVVVAVLLTVIGIAAVLVFWGAVQDLISPRRLSATIDSAQLIKGAQRTRLAFALTNSGTIDFTIRQVKLEDSTLQCNPSGVNMPPGSSYSFLCDVTMSVVPGSSYLLSVEVQGGGKTSIVTTTVIAREG